MAECNTRQRNSAWLHAADLSVVGASEFFASVSSALFCRVRAKLTHPPTPPYPHPLSDIALNGREKEISGLVFNTNARTGADVGGWFISVLLFREIGAALYPDGASWLNELVTPTLSVLGGRS